MLISKGDKLGGFDSFFETISFTLSYSVKLVYLVPLIPASYIIFCILFYFDDLFMKGISLRGLNTIFCNLSSA